ncbi:MAG: Ig-like domain-containing protein [Limnobacter sp.]|uniref:Ig-like domain-containing protein n=1 Tax=Limnobacter sp. TaxID=2003368 RepID=UPI0022BD384F|nr:Ig-like domain-containing protein [Limnobacter sp.]MCZ8015482.1 Ig-like domain-containing protein [Limnobacter sp.]
MSEKPVVNTQNCDPSTLGLARKPRPAMKKKPATEVVVQLGPFTDGQITAPEMVRPLEGPTEWLIKPNTGEIVPFEAGTPPEKDVIRKYITVGAQDTDVPEDLPKIGDGYVVERVSQDPLPSMDSVVRQNGTDTVRVIENEGPAAVECKDPPPPPVDENEEPPVDPNEPECPTCPPCPPVCEPPVDEEECPTPPVCPPVDEQEDCDPPVDEEECPTPPVCPPVDEQEDCDPPVEEEECPTPPVCPPVDEQEDCDPPVEEEECTPPPVCPPVDEQEDCDTPADAVNDCATTTAGCPVVIDVLKNDLGCGELEITEACAENGQVEIKDGKLHYTPNEGFCGEDVISYTMGDENCMNDTAHVYMNVTPAECPQPSGGCEEITENACPVVEENCDTGGSNHVRDYEYSSSSYNETLFSEQMDKVNEILNDKMEHINNLIQGKSSWASSYGAGNQFESAACAPVEEPAAAC